jgi:isocitrate/isopropylmalate dehydrogenase
MLRHLGDEASAARLERAVEASVQAGKTTKDLGGTLSTEQVTQEILARL